MSTVYVLIIIYAGYQTGGAGISQEFNSKEKCETAKNIVKKELGFNLICVEK